MARIYVAPPAPAEQAPMRQLSGASRYPQQVVGYLSPGPRSIAPRVVTSGPVVLRRTLGPLQVKEVASSPSLPVTPSYPSRVQVSAAQVCTQRVISAGGMSTWMMGSPPPPVVAANYHQRQSLGSIRAPTSSTRKLPSMAGFAASRASTPNLAMPSPLPPTLLRQGSSTVVPPGSVRFSLGHTMPIKASTSPMSSLSHSSPTCANRRPAVFSAPAPSAPALPAQFAAHGPYSLPVIERGESGRQPSELQDHEVLVAPRRLSVTSLGAREEDTKDVGYLRLVAGACQVPHSAKAEAGGDDSFFIGSEGLSLGVADGVGDWERLAVQPRNAADELMEGAKRSVSELLKRRPRLGASDLAKGAMGEAYRSLKSYGASTALVAVLDAARQALGVANLGDSSFRQVRRSSGTGQLQIVASTREQQHFFNCPYQFSRVPLREEIPTLIAENKPLLVAAVEEGMDMLQDTLEDVEVSVLSVKDGDLLLLATDGVFDNLWDSEILQICEPAVSPFEASQVWIETAGALRGPRSATDPVSIAEAVAIEAAKRGRANKGQTPFAESARRHGFSHSGGKEDDTTVVVAWVVRSLTADADAK